MNITLHPGDSIQQAIVEHGKGTYVLTEGTYHEKVEIKDDDITLEGEGRAILSWDDYADRPAPDGTKLGTFRTATLFVTGKRFKAKRLIIENAFDFQTAMKDFPYDPGNHCGLQAVAFRSGAEADGLVLDHCRLLGWQDTLLLDSPHALLQKCYISGNIDFIFGSGMAHFELCEIESRGKGYVCAPSTKGGTYGFLVTHCLFTKEFSVAPSSVWIGRPWHPNADPSVVSWAGLVDCRLDDHIIAEGWTLMHGVLPDKVHLVYFYPKDSVFFECGSYGPGKPEGVHLDRKIVSREQGEAEMLRFSKECPSV
jgi:pectinesterase